MALAPKREERVFKRHRDLSFCCMVIDRTGPSRSLMVVLYNRFLTLFASLQESQHNADFIQTRKDLNVRTRSCSAGYATNDPGTRRIRGRNDTGQPGHSPSHSKR